MSRTLIDIAKEKVLRAKKEAKRKIEEFKESMKNYKPPLSVQEKITKYILKPLKRSKNGNVLNEDLYMKTLEDGNLIGYHKEVGYFKSYQKDDEMYFDIIGKYRNWMVDTDLKYYRDEYYYDQYNVTTVRIDDNLVPSQDTSEDRYRHFDNEEREKISTSREEKEKFPIIDKFCKEIDEQRKALLTAKNSSKRS